MCTALLYTDANGSSYKGRTIEFSGLFPSALTLLPSGTSIESLTPSGTQGLTFSTKYAILGMALPAIPNAKQPTLVDAMNERGLTVSGNAQGDLKTPPLGNDPTKILSAADLVAWILGNFEKVSEVKEALSADIELWLPTLPLFDNAPFPVHYGVWDQSGEGIVIELLNGKLNIHDNPVGALTNGPEFPWHLTNLINYTQSNVDRNTSQFGKLKVTTPDAGIALAILPSSQTAIGRFVKAAFYVNYVRKAKTPDEAIQTIGHIMNNFDRPNDLSVDEGSAGGDGGGGDGISSEVTNYTVMNDLSRNLYYVRSINALNWTVVDFNKIKNIKKIKSLNTYDVNKLGNDATSYFLSEDGQHS